MNICEFLIKMDKKPKKLDKAYGAKRWQSVSAVAGLESKAKGHTSYNSFSKRNMQWTPLRITGLIGCLYPLLLPLRNGLLNPCAVSHQCSHSSNYCIWERESKKMASFRFSFGFGVVAAVVLSLIFTLYMPVAVHAQSLAPAPAPTSDGY